MEHYSFYVAFALTQLLHSQEEIWTDFHKKWFVFTMPRWSFVGFEAVLSIFIVLYLFKPELPFANQFMILFSLVMFINGIGHIVWALVKRSYVPGLITAPIFVILFCLYYFKELV